MVWRFACTVAFLVVIGNVARGQEAEDKGAPSPGADDAVEAVPTMRALRASIAALEEKLSDLREKHAAVESEAEKEAVSVEIRAATEELDRVRADYEGVVTGIDLDAYRLTKPGEIHLGEELEEFLQPIVKELKDMTEKPREIDELRKLVSYHRERQAMAQKAVDHIEGLRKEVEEEDMRADVEVFRKEWMGKLEQVRNDLTVARFQLEEEMASAGSLLDNVSQVVQSFFRSRGWNLFLATLAFAGVFLGLRFLRRIVYRLPLLRNRQGRSFYARLADVLYGILALVGATGAALVVLYSAADWVLLGLAVLLLFGLAWSGRQALPLFYEQAKLMLNLGAVREGERLVYGGIPWQVQRVHFYTDLVNPALQGGHLRLPLRDLVPLHSRPIVSREAWFPCEQEDWVMLSDGTFGKVIAATPDWVQLVLLGGSRKTYPVVEFLGLSPENLSHDFRIRAVFGIDYKHQALSTDDIPARLEAKLTAALTELVAPGELHHLAVEFSEAGSSSLDYAVLADFAGSAASKHNKLKRAISRICVDACNENGWVIPFTQITLHRAPEEAVDERADHAG